MADELNLDEMPDIYTLSDDEGNEYTFEVLDEAEYGDDYYLVLLPIYDDPKDAPEGEEDAYIIVRQVTEGDEQYCEVIENEDNFMEIFDFFAKRLDDIYNMTV